MQLPQVAPATRPYLRFIMGYEFPLHYKPRPYQAELHQMWRSHRIGVAVLPRQSGKDVAACMENVQRRLMFAKTTGVYVSTDKPSIRNILWDKTYPDPVTGQQLQMLQDNVPSDLVSWKGNAMEGRFTNKSILKLDGYFQSGQNKNGVGTSFDDYTFTELSLFTKEDPLPRLRPIISSEYGRKRLMAVATPRGRRQNPLWLLMQENKGDSQYMEIIRTIDDLNEIMRKHGLPPVRSQEQLEKDREAYLQRFGNDRMFMQEYYVSFDEMDAAAVYGEALAQMLKDKRVETVLWDKRHPVYVAFDIGSSGIQSDATSWIAFQWFNNKLFLIDCGEGHGRALPDYVDDLIVKDWYNNLGYIILPWDGDHHEVSIKTTPADMMRQRFGNVAVLAKGTNIYTVKGLPNTASADLITMVQQVRMQLYHTYIDEKACDLVVRGLENYKYAYDAKAQMWSAKPVHDKYSHMMDALRYVVQAIKELDFFQGKLYDSTAAASSDTVIDDWAGVWG